MKLTTMSSRPRRRRLAKMESLEARQLLACDVGTSSILVADLNCDDEVGFSDFLLLADAFGSAAEPSGSGADLDSDGIVAFPDFLILADNFGSTTDESLEGLTPQICEDRTMLVSLLSDLQSGGLGSIGLGGDGPSYGQVNRQQIQRMLLQSPTDGPFYMVNLIEYRDEAQYADGRETVLTGREANALYNVFPYIDAIGGRVVFNGQVDGTTLGGDSTWDDVVIAEYPCPAAFLVMIAQPGVQETSIHKDAGVQASTVRFATQPL